jgi:4-hydroxybenzoate polyprenyltransferase
VHDIVAPRAGLGAHVRAARPHHWLKNLLVFVPLLAGHDFRFGTILAGGMAFLAFCLTASGTYVLNDLLDLEPDRAHPRKRLRPFASGAVPTRHGAWLALALWLGGLALGALLGMKFLAVLQAYFETSLAYSLYLKRHMVIDIPTPAALYTSRIAAGGVATGIVLSEWLLAFAIFFFLSLAAVKRQAELASDDAPGDERLNGRGYVRADLPLVSQMALAAGYVSVLVLAMYLNSDAVTVLYRAPFALLGICLVLLFWLSRMALLAHRGAMHDDPLVFALTDRTSLACGVLAAGCAVLATSW